LVDERDILYVLPTNYGGGPTLEGIVINLIPRIARVLALPPAIPSPLNTSPSFSIILNSPLGGLDVSKYLFACPQSIQHPPSTRPQIMALPASLEEVEEEVSTEISPLSLSALSIVIHSLDNQMSNLYLYTFLGSQTKIATYNFR
jgi:hypothetical protein